MDYTMAKGLGYTGGGVFDKELAAGEPIFVLNNTEPRGILICTVNDPVSGKPRKLEFPKTWIPFCLTDMLPASAIENAIELRQYASSGLLKKIPKEDALQILNSDRGQKEFNRLTKSKFSRDSIMNDAKKGMMASEEVNRGLNNVNNPGVDTTELRLHPKVKAWERRIVAGEFDSDTLINEIEIHRNELGREDFNYLLTGQFPEEVKAVASESIEKGQYNEAAALAREQQAMKLSASLKPRDPHQHQQQAGISTYTPDY